MAVFILSACSGSSNHEPNEANFTTAINTYLQSEGITIEIADKIPIEVDIEQLTSNAEINAMLTSRGLPKRRPTTRRKDRPTGLKARCEALERAGLLSGTVRVVERRDTKYITNTPILIKYKVKKYDLTGSGKTLIKAPDNAHAKYRLKIATAKVESIDHFTSPTPVEGFTVCKVKYTYSPDKIISFVKSKRFIDSYPQIEKKLKKEQQQVATLVLMGSGWEHGATAAEKIQAK
jgi:hypothetical protein